MATAIAAIDESTGIHGSLNDDARAIGGATFDAIFFWGAPLVALAFVCLWSSFAILLPEQVGHGAVSLLAGAVGVLTFAHLIAVVPRAYFNREVFADHRARLTIAPLLLVAGFLISPALLVLGGLTAVFWDVHHTAMQNFGLGRIYDMKAGNNALTLRRTDLVLNWGLYVGPLAAGASLLSHFAGFGQLRTIDLAALAETPGVLQHHAGLIRDLAIAAWLAVGAGALLAYRLAMRRGYRLPAHKAALIASTGFVSIAAWGFTPPFMAFAIVNLFHAMQYFAIVWLKEGGRITARLRLAPGRRIALPFFLALCGLFGLAYFAANSFKLFLAPFIACSLLHFWYDSFVWSVRKKQV
ncbi:MAG: hypothetical protein JO276_10080 [Sphingomonadaceae bacterium]|nr:hypothetical protein [Sphingomonadaceae bacterium]